MAKSKKKKKKTQTPCDQIVRGFFSLGGHEKEIQVYSSEDFLVHIIARTGYGGDAIITLETSPSQYQGAGSNQPILDPDPDDPIELDMMLPGHDTIGLDIPEGKSTYLGCIGGAGGSRIDFKRARGNVDIFLTVVTAHNANAMMTWR